MRFLRWISSITLSGALVASASNARADDLPKLTEDNGPFMVLAYSFRGPEAELSARTLARELRKDHELPSFVLRGPDNAFDFGSVRTRWQMQDRERGD